MPSLYPPTAAAHTLFYGDNVAILRGAEVRMPPAHGRFKQAPRVR